MLNNEIFPIHDIIRHCNIEGKYATHQQHNCILTQTNIYNPKTCFAIILYTFIFCMTMPFVELHVNTQLLYLDLITPEKNIIEKLYNF